MSKVARVPAAGEAAAEGAAEGAPITLETIQKDPTFSNFIVSADRVMDGLGYTEHGFRHANLTGKIAFNLIARLERDRREAELASIAGYLHDLGNMVAREAHGQVGAVLAHGVLRNRMAPDELALVMAGIGNHEEPEGAAAGPIPAAVILADKSDVHRSRVRKADAIEFDIHDRVNYAATQSFLRVDSGARTITLELTIDTEISQVMEYFEIFLDRMVMCRRAAEQLDCTFKLTINGATLL
ncbi:MAG TPA: HD domain-containing protein [Actinomycetota bacterium]|nr:HD domain-containing protein [Actinomycetota bacterium]